MITAYQAVVLAGGRASRLGGPSKPDLVVDGHRLLDTALKAARGAEQVVVVGDAAVPPGILRTREDPPFGGPVAGLEAGLGMLGTGSPWTLVLASDLPDAEAAVRVLLRAEPAPEHDGACLVDGGGRLQWLIGCYRTPVLRQRLAERDGATAMYRLLEPLNLLAVDPGTASVVDLDTPGDVVRWAARRDKS